VIIGNLIKIERKDENLEWKRNVRGRQNEKRMGKIINK